MRMSVCVYARILKMLEIEVRFQWDTMAYDKSIGHVTDDVTCPTKVTVVTRIFLGQLS